MTTWHLRATGVPATALVHCCVQAAAPTPARYRRLVAPVFGTAEGTGLSITGTVNPISKAAVLGDTPGTSTWSPPV